MSKIKASVYLSNHGVVTYEYKNFGEIQRCQVCMGKDSLSGAAKGLAAFLYRFRNFEISFPQKTKIIKYTCDGYPGNYLRQGLAEEYIGIFYKYFDEALQQFITEKKKKKQSRAISEN